MGLQSIFFFKPATNGQSDKGFLLTSNACPQGVVCPCPRAIYIYKIIKNVYKMRFLFLNLQRMGKVIWSFCRHQKLDFEEIILKLATYGQREKAFLLSSKFCPQCFVCPCPGLYTCGKHEKTCRDCFKTCNKWAK